MQLLRRSVRILYQLRAVGCRIPALASRVRAGSRYRIACHLYLRPSRPGEIAPCSCDDHLVSASSLSLSSNQSHPLLQLASSLSLSCFCFSPVSFILLFSSPYRLFFLFPAHRVCSGEPLSCWPLSPILRSISIKLPPSFAAHSRALPASSSRFLLFGFIFCHFAPSLTGSSSSNHSDGKGVSKQKAKARREPSSETTDRLPADAPRLIRLHLHLTPDPGSPAQHPASPEPGTRLRQRWQTGYRDQTPAVPVKPHRPASSSLGSVYTALSSVFCSRLPSGLLLQTRISVLPLLCRVYSLSRHLLRDAQPATRNHASANQTTNSPRRSPACSAPLYAALVLLDPSLVPQIRRLSPTCQSSVFLVTHCCTAIHLPAL